jgi:hypothetical protein
MGRGRAQTAPHVLLVGCVKTQLPHAAPADELFVSALFRRRRDFAERSGRPWFVLSSRHGLVRPEQVIEPYDLCLARQPIAVRRDWGRLVIAQLDAALGDLTDRTLEIHAGSAHIAPIEPALRVRGAIVETPLHGLALGRHLAWYGGTT